MTLFIDSFESPIGSVHVVSDGRALCAIDFGAPEERLLPLLRARFGVTVTLRETDDPGARPAHAGLLRGRPRRARRPAGGRRGHPVPAARLGGAARDPRRHDRDLRRPRRSTWCAAREPGGRRSYRAKPGEHRRTLPSRDRRGRWAHRVRGRARAQAVAPRARARRAVVTARGRSGEGGSRARAVGDTFRPPGCWNGRAYVERYGAPHRARRVRRSAAGSRAGSVLLPSVLRRGSAVRSAPAARSVAADATETDASAGRVTEDAVTEGIARESRQRRADDEARSRSSRAARRGTVPASSLVG